MYFHPTLSVDLDVVRRTDLNCWTLKKFSNITFAIRPNAMVKFIWAEKVAFAIQKSMGSSFGWCSNWYRGKVSKELKKYGLRYDDLYDEIYDHDIMEALHRLPIQVQDLRNQRLKRAMDCGLKHSYLDKEMQAKQTPYEFYLQDTLAQVQIERRERDAQGSYMPYEREMP